MITTNSININNIESKLLVNEKQNENENVLPQFKNIYEIYIHKIKKILSIYIKKILGADNIYKDSISIFSSNLSAIPSKSAPIGLTAELKLSIIFMELMSSFP